MQNPFSLKRTHLTALFGTALMGTTVMAPLTAQAQIRIPARGNPTTGAILQNPNILAFARVQPKLTPELRDYLVAKKPVVNAELLKSAFVLQDGIPAFKLDDGTTRLLMPSDESPSAAPAVALAPELNEARSYIYAPLKLNSVRNNILKFNQQYVLATGVDHRSDMTPIRDQGPRGTCTAFAFLGAVEAFPNVHTDLSEQYLFHEGQRKAGQPYSTHKGLLPKLAAEVGTEGLVRESAWPYSFSYPLDSETIPTDAINAKKYKVTNWQFVPNAGLTGVSIRNPNYIETLLDKGYNVTMWTQVAWYGSHNNDVIDVVIDSATHQPAASGGDHEMVIVGYNAPQKYFIVRNSWGTGFGHAGYAYMSYDYIRTYAVEGLYITKVSAPPLLLNPGFQTGILLKPKFRINP
ncbi:hypothetical protein IAD21_06001 [Abditibacteriota bacterium]|nr:hypothetical protein IAD21_06001 [Abditibacteriota bacterium]